MNDIVLFSVSFALFMWIYTFIFIKYNENIIELQVKQIAELKFELSLFKDKRVEK